MVTAGWIAIALEVLLLLTWIYSIFIKPNGTDPAGKGMAMVFVIGLCVYIAAGILLLLLQQTWSLILVLLLAAIPLVIVIIGLWKKYGPGNRQF